MSLIVKQYSITSSSKLFCRHIHETCMLQTLGLSVQDNLSLAPNIIYPISLQLHFITLQYHLSALCVVRKDTNNSLLTEQLPAVACTL